jgi:hypothetical protein
MSQRHAEVLLAHWRDVERRLAVTEAGTLDAESLQAEASRLRDEYQRLVDALRETDATADNGLAQT